MPEKIPANATPEKRLFISLITRDISLIAAFLDLIDNSINSAVEPMSPRLRTAEDYLYVFQDESVVPEVDINLLITPDNVQIKDTASGISADTASRHVFKFGRSEDEEKIEDRLSVYGIGLKRALFKLGNNISIKSDHIDGGFDMELNVSSWAKIKTQPWTFEITPRTPVQPGESGTEIIVKELYDYCTRRISDGIFLGQLKEAISKTYAFYLSRFVNIYVNDEKIEGLNLEVGSNYVSDSFTVNNVTCAITAGLGTPQGGSFRDKSSGWFVFCNGRTVISADKTPLTGWGGGGLPIFQPKHRPFLGTVFFVSVDAEKLPWTTTKAGINEDSAVWQEAKRYMSTIGRKVIKFLDERYSDEGTSVASSDLQEAAGDRVSIMTAATVQKKEFKPLQKTRPEIMRIQYDAKISDVKSIAHYLGRPSMTGADVGRHTFFHFLKNEVGEK